MHRKSCTSLDSVVIIQFSEQFLDLGSKKIQFSLFNPQDVVKLSEFQVTHRDLYTPIDRVPVKNGVLDRRLVRPLLINMTYLKRGLRRTAGDKREERVLRDVRTEFC